MVLFIGEYNVIGKVDTFPLSNKFKLFFGYKI
jgi:hypothetical protein